METITSVNISFELSHVKSEQLLLKFLHGTETMSLEEFSGKSFVNMGKLLNFSKPPFLQL